MADKSFIALHVTPRAGRDEIVGVEEGASGLEIRVRVTAPPDGGKANKAVCKLVAGALDLPKTAVEVVSGQTSRHKRVAAACSQEAVDAWIASLD